MIELRVTQAAASHHVAQLEDLLGVTFFTWTSRGLVPTDEGRRSFPVLEHGFDATARVPGRLGGRRDIEVLKVDVNTTFALGRQIPRLEMFRQAHPDIDLRSTNNSRVEILRKGLDMAIRFGTGGRAGHEAIPLTEAPLSPLCAPSVTTRLVEPADLAQVTLLRGYRSTEWAGWFAATATTCPPVPGPVFDSLVAPAKIAASRAAAALLPVAMFESWTALGRLPQPYGVTMTAGRYCLAGPADRPQTPVIRSSASWVSGKSLS